jgi:hypothetical protein
VSVSILSSTVATGNVRWVGGFSSVGVGSWLEILFGQMEVKVGVG